MQLEKVYEPQQFEPRWAKWWEESGIYQADPNKPGKAFSIAIPPPNVTGSLHIGHMIGHTEMDVVTRYHRMIGDNTLWIPGTDHAGIATQMVVERDLAKQNITRHDLGREAFEAKIWDWKALYGGNIERQMRKIGDSVDWTRNRFTLDDGLSRAVREVFVRMHEDGLIYRGEYMVTWCPRCNTAISDLEVNHEDTAGSLWEIDYPVTGQPGRVLTVATTRPETMLGDTAVAINAADERYLDLHGKTVQLPLMNREIPIVCDDMADPEFGTGVVKITPAHDPNDFEAGKRHSLPIIQVISPLAVMTDAAGPYAGLDRGEARKRVLADLEAAGLLRAVKPHHLPISKCQRCSTIVEPLISKQWFVRMKELAAPAIKAVETGETVFIPENWSKTYFEWMYNIRDWCISRQLWWGHRIPAWHCADCTGITVARQTPNACQHCASANITQDTDVLDTWFSSGLWPFSTLGWPDETEDLKKYYPTSVLITGFDIIFFWVARMMVMGIYCTKQVPFRHVYIHGLVRDAERQKMSKTKGNVIDPLSVTEKYGTDAVRMSLLLAASPGTDIIASEDRMESARAFANKIWNAARFLFLNLERAEAEPWSPTEQTSYQPEAAADGEVPLEDRWIFSRLNNAAGEINKAIDTYRFHEAAQLQWHFFWHDFCDWYIELKKLRFVDGSGLNAHWRNILTVFDASLRLLHPSMPFLTEELWQRLGTHAKVSISLAAFPQFHPASADPAAEREMAILQELITAARTLRAESKLDPKAPFDAVIYADGTVATLAASQKEAISKLANLNLTLAPASAERAKGSKRSTPEFDLVLAISAAQLDAQRDRLGKEIEQLTKIITGSEAQLSNEAFLAKAPEKVLTSMREKLADYKAQLAKSHEALNEF